MNYKKLLFTIFVLVILLSGGFFVEKNYSGEQNQSNNRKSPKNDIITIYKKGKEIRILPTSPYFKDLKYEIENFTINSDNGYELIPSESRFNSLKKSGYAIELIYASPKELPIRFFKRPILVKRIFIPLQGGDFPYNLVFVYEHHHEDFPHALANTKQNKDNLLKLIEPLNYTF